VYGDIRRAREITQNGAGGGGAAAHRIGTASCFAVRFAKREVFLDEAVVSPPGFIEPTGTGLQTRLGSLGLGLGQVKRLPDNSSEITIVFMALPKLEQDFPEQAPWSRPLLRLKRPCRKMDGSRSASADLGPA